MQVYSKTKLREISYKRLMIVSQYSRYHFHWNKEPIRPSLVLQTKKVARSLFCGFSTTLSGRWNPCCLLVGGTDEHDFNLKNHMDWNLRFSHFIANNWGARNNSSLVNFIRKSTVSASLTFFSQKHWRRLPWFSFAVVVVGRPCQYTTRTTELFTWRLLVNLFSENRSPERPVSYERK